MIANLLPVNQCITSTKLGCSSFEDVGAFSINMSMHDWLFCNSLKSSTVSSEIRVYQIYMTSWNLAKSIPSVIVGKCNRKLKDKGSNPTQELIIET